MGGGKRSRDGRASDGLHAGEGSSRESLHEHESRFAEIFPVIFDPAHGCLPEKQQVFVPYYDVFTFPELIEGVDAHPGSADIQGCSKVDFTG
jgi:hypothetical protein